MKLKKLSALLVALVIFLFNINVFAESIRPTLEEKYLTRGISNTKAARDSNTLDSVVAANKFERSFAIPDTPMRLRFFGFVSGTFIYDIADQGPSDTILPSTIGTYSPSQSDGHLRFNASRTNFGIEVRTPVPGCSKPLKLVLVSGYSPLASASVDASQRDHVKQLLANDENNIIAAAYVEIGDFLFGQYATNFMDIHSLPELINYGGNAGAYGIAAPQAKYTYRFGCKCNNALAISVENPQTEYILNNVKVTDVNASAPFYGAMPVNYYTSGVPSAFLTNAVTQDYFPDLVVSFDSEQDWGHVFASAMVRELRVSGNPISPNFNPAAYPSLPAVGQGLVPTLQQRIEAHALSYAVNLSGKINMDDCQHDNITAHVIFGYGMGRYALGTADQTAWIDLDKDPNTFERLYSYVGHVAYQHYWSDKWRSTLLYGFVFNDTDENTPKIVNKWIQSFAVNLMYAPTPIMRIGVEYIYMKRTFLGEPAELFLPKKGNISRVEAQARLYF